MSKSANIQKPEKSRYDFKNYKYVQVAVGVIKNSKKREQERRLEVGNMESADHPFFRIEDYEPLSEVELNLTYDPQTETIHVVCSVIGIVIQEYQIKNVEYFSHFQVFAWADWTPYELDFSYHFSSKSKHDENDKETIFSPLENLEFKHGDLFDLNYLKAADLLVLPVSSKGKVDSNILRGANTFGFPVPESQLVGTISIHEMNMKSGPEMGAWAYTEKDSDGSSLAIISDVVRELIVARKTYLFKRIALPLLGIGTGNLNQIDVAKLFCQICKDNINQVKLVVFIKSIKDFKTIRKEIEIWISEKYFNRTLPDILGRHDVDGVLGVKDLAANLAGLLARMPTDQDTMMGIFGKWGRGKTRLMDEIFAVLNRENKAIRVDFHAWKYQDTPASWAYLYEQFSEKYFQEYKSEWNQFWRRICLNFNRLGKWRWAIFLIGFGLSVYISIGISFWTKFKFILSLLGTLGIGGAISLFFIYNRFGKTAKSLIKEYSKKMSFAHYLGIQAEVQKELKTLLQTWSKRRRSLGKRIYLFVDDIDRCSEDNIISVVDSLRVMVEDPEISKRVVIIAAIDDRILKRAIKFKYKALIGTDNEDLKQFENLTKEYFDKLFITGINLHDLNASEREEFFEAAVKKFRSQTPELDINDNVPDLANIILDEKKVENDVKIDVDINDAVNKDFESGEVDGINRLTEIPETPAVWISIEEYELFKDCLTDCPVITPRQIKIVFYRYLLAKAILDSAYGSSINIWRLSGNSRILMKALISKSFVDNFDILTIKRLNSGVLKSLAKETDFDKLISAINLVVAY